MSELTPVGPSNNAEPTRTIIGRFLATRGVIIIKEIKDIGTIKCEYKAKLHAETLILRTAKSSSKVESKSYGIRLELLKDEETVDTAVLDFDEAEEFGNAIQFVFDAAQKLRAQQTDYIEATFSTKDSIEVGFFQTNEQDQKAFVKLGRGADSCFLQIASIPSFKRLIEAARAHLIQKGAEV